MYIKFQFSDFDADVHSKRHARNIYKSPDGDEYEPADTNSVCVTATRFHLHNELEFGEHVGH